MVVLLHQLNEERTEKMARMPKQPAPGFKKPEIGKPVKTKPDKTAPKPPRNKPKGW
jgi:hypothetical protein